MLYSNPLVAVVFAGLLFSGYIYFHLTRRQRAVAPLDTLLESNQELQSEHGLE
jgi:ethanolamine permease